MYSARVYGSFLCLWLSSSSVWLVRRLLYESEVLVVVVFVEYFQTVEIEWASNYLSLGGCESESEM